MEKAPDADILPACWPDTTRTKSSDNGKPTTLRRRCLALLFRGARAPPKFVDEPKPRGTAATGAKTPRTYATGGGNATASGVNFQQSLGALFGVWMLTETPVDHRLRLGGAKLIAIRMETEGGGKIDPEPGADLATLRLSSWVEPKQLS